MALSLLVAEAPAGLCEEGVVVAVKAPWRAPGRGQSRPAVHRALFGRPRGSGRDQSTSAPLPTARS